MPDTRRPSQWWKAPPPGTAPHHPRSTQPPQGMQAKGTVLGPHTHTPAPTACGWGTPTTPPVGGQFREGERLTTDAPHNGGRHPPGTPFRHPHSEQRRPARAHAVGLVLIPHARTNRTRDTRVAEPRLPAAKDGRPGERQRLTPDAPHNGGRPPPPGTAPHHPRGTKAPTGHAGQGNSVGPPHPHARANSMWLADPNNPPSGRAVQGGGAPDHRRPSQQWKATAPGMPFRHPDSEQRRPPRAHAVGPVLIPHARTDRTRDTRVAEPRLPAPKDGRPGEGQRLTPDAPHNGGRPPPPPGTAPHRPRGTQPPQGMQAKGTVLGPHTHTPAPTARGWQTPTARPVGGQSGEGERLTSDAPHNGGRHPRGNALPPPPQRATPARKGARCGAGADSPRPHRPHPGHTGRGTPATRPKGRTAGGGTAPDTRRPSQRWQATPPPRDGPPPPPRHAAPTGHAGQGDSVGPPHPHTRAHSTWVADPNSPPSGRAVGGGGAPDLRRPSQRWKSPPAGKPFRHPHSEQRRPARAHAVGPVLDPGARTDRTRNTQVAVPRLPAPEDGRPGEGQRLTPDAPHNGGRPPPPPGDGPPPPPRHAAPTGHASQGDSVWPSHPHTRAHSTWVADLNSPPSGRAVGGGTAPDLRRPSQWWKAPPTGTPFRHPHSEQRWPARAHAVGPVLGPHAGTDRTRDTRVAEPWLPAPEDGRPGEGQRLTPDAPHNGGGHPPRGRPSATSTASNAGPQGRTLWGRCWVPTPAPTAPGTHGSQNPGCPLQRAGGWRRDSA